MLESVAPNEFNWKANLWFGKVNLVVDQRGQVLFGVLHYEEYIVQTFAHCHASKLYNISMIQFAQQINLPYAADGKAILGIVYSHTLQSQYFVALCVPGPVDHTISALANSIELLKFADVAALSKLDQGG